MRTDLVTLDPKKLSQELVLKLSSVEVHTLSFSVWEVGLKFKQGKIDLGMSFDLYLNKLQQIHNLKIIDLTLSILVNNLKLDWTHKDTVDRSIVAYAKQNDLYIATKDLKIKDFYNKCLD